MTFFVQLMVSGVALGIMYGLVAAGFVIVYKATNILNFAFQALLVIGAYTIARLAFFNFALAVLAGIGITVLIAMGIDQFLLRHVAGRTAIALTTLTLGVDIILLTIATMLIDTQIIPIGDPWGNSLLVVGGIVLPWSRIVASLTGALIVGLLFAWLKRSSWGIAFRAATEKREIAPLMGIPLNRLSVLSWAIAGALAAVAGLFLSTFPVPGVGLSLGAVAFRALPAAVIGGLDSVHGAIVGGLIVGISEILFQGYQSSTWFLPAGIHGVMTWVIMIAVLMIRPSGLFGSEAVRRA